MRWSTDGLEVGGMDGCGEGEGFVDEEVLLVLGSCWFDEEVAFAFTEVTSIRLVPFVGARKTRGTSCGRQMSDIVLTA